MEQSSWSDVNKTPHYSNDAIVQGCKKGCIVDYVSVSNL